MSCLPGPLITQGHEVTNYEVLLTMGNRNVQIAVPSTGEEEWQAIREPIMNGWLTQGPKVESFEDAFAKMHSVKHAIATTSCTTALHLILAAMEIGPGDEVIVPSFTWVATANVVLYCGAKPVFVDINRDTFNMDPAQVAERVSERTKAIIPVHLFGLCADIDNISAAAPGIPIIEDAACAAGALYHGKSAGSLGKAAAFSFHPRKSITTGEGGMITTDDTSIARLLMKLRNHGAEIPGGKDAGEQKPYFLPDINMLGFNYRMTDMQGAVGLVQLNKLDPFIVERGRWARWYKEQLGDIGWLHLPKEPADGRHSWQSFVAYLDPDKSPLTRNEIMEFLQENGVSTRPGTHAVHMLNLYRGIFGFHPEDFPVARDCNDNSMAIPLHNRMMPEDFEHVVETIRKI